MQMLSCEEINFILKSKKGYFIVADQITYLVVL